MSNSKGRRKKAQNRTALKISAVQVKWPTEKKLRVYKRKKLKKSKKNSQMSRVRKKQPTGIVIKKVVNLRAISNLRDAGNVTKLCGTQFRNSNTHRFYVPPEIVATIASYAMGFQDFVKFLKLSKANQEYFVSESNLFTSVLFPVMNASLMHFRRKRRYVRRIQFRGDYPKDKWNKNVKTYIIRIKASKIKAKVIWSSFPNLREVQIIDNNGQISISQIFKDCPKLEVIIIRRSILDEENEAKMWNNGAWAFPKIPARMKKVVLGNSIQKRYRPSQFEFNPSLRGLEIDNTSYKVDIIEDNNNRPNKKESNCLVISEPKILLRKLPNLEELALKGERIHFSIDQNNGKDILSKLKRLYFTVETWNKVAPTIRFDNDELFWSVEEFGITCGGSSEIFNETIPFVKHFPKLVSLYTERFSYPAHELTTLQHLKKVVMKANSSLDESFLRSTVCNFTEYVFEECVFTGKALNGFSPKKLTLRNPWASQQTQNLIKVCLNRVYEVIANGSRTNFHIVGTSNLEWSPKAKKAPSDLLLFVPKFKRVGYSMKIVRKKKFPLIELHPKE